MGNFTPGFKSFQLLGKQLLTNTAVKYIAYKTFI